MTEPMLEQIKGRLEAATPGPWHHSWLASEYDHDPSWLIDFTHREATYPDEVGSVQREEDAELIAHAPADIAWLILQLEVTRETNTRLNHRLQEAESRRARQRDEYLAGGAWATNRVQELAKHLAHWESQKHVTVGIGWLRSHFGIREGR
jgi:hypothetical protein